jgi:alkylhydroperoxidase family enzyme
VLPRDVREVVALTVARAAGCDDYTNPGDSLLRVLDPTGRYAQAVADGRLDDPAVPPAVRALAQLARAVTERTHGDPSPELASAIAHGWRETEVCETVWIAISFSLFVRLADTLALSDATSS